MRRRAAWRLLQPFLVFVVAVACSAPNGDAARASTGEATAIALTAETDAPAAKSDSTAARPGSTAARPDSTVARPDSVSTIARPDSVSTIARPDSVSTVQSDSTSTVPADSSGAGPAFKPKGTSALPDTLQFLPPPGSQTGGEPKAGGAAAKPKERTGLLGLTPIAILLGIAVLNYFVIKAVTH